MIYILNNINTSTLLMIFLNIANGRSFKDGRLQNIIMKLTNCSYPRQQLSFKIFQQSATTRAYVADLVG